MLKKKDQADSTISRKCNNVGTSRVEEGQSAGVGTGDRERERVAGS